MAKKRTSRTPPSELLSELQVELDTPFSLEECVAQLENAHKGRRGLGQPMFAVDITNADAIQVDFAMYLGSGWAVGWFTGHIRNTDGQGGLLTGVVGLDPVVAFTFGMPVVVPFAGFAVTQSILVALLGFGFAAVIVWWLFREALQLRYELIDILEEML